VLKELFSRFRGGQSMEVPGYVAMGMIREGSMAKIFKAGNQETGQIVALKVLKPTARRVVEKLEAHFRDFTEGQITASMDHPNVIKCFDHGQVGDLPYVVLEYLDGMTLASLLGGDSSRLVGKRLAILEQTAAGLAHVHTRRFVHHDFCAKNVFLTTEGRVKVIDFGLATPLLSQPSVISRLGTPEILAPEILRREPSDYRVDIFAFGIVAYEVLTGHWPFESTEVHQTPMLKVLNVKPVPVEKRVPAVPVEVATMIMRCLEKEAAKRPTSLNAVVSILARHRGAL